MTKKKNMSFNSWDPDVYDVAKITFIHSVINAQWHTKLGLPFCGDTLYNKTVILLILVVYNWELGATHLVRYQLVYVSSSQNVLLTMSNRPTWKQSHWGVRTSEFVQVLQLLKKCLNWKIKLEGTWKVLKNSPWKVLEMTQTPADKKQTSTILVETDQWPQVFKKLPDYQNTRTTKT